MMRIERKLLVDPSPRYTPYNVRHPNWSTLPFRIQYQNGNIDTSTALRLGNSGASVVVLQRIERQFLLKDCYFPFLFFSFILLASFLQFLTNINSLTSGHVTSRQLNSTQSIPRFQHKYFTSPTIMSPSTQFIELLKARRTIYALEAKSPIPDSKIQEIVEQAILHVPSSFNSQTTRVVLLFKGEHEKLWNITEEVLKGVVPPEQFEGTAKRIGGFRNGYGTVSWFLPFAFTLLFRELSPSQSAIRIRYLCRERFPGWATQSDAITQYAIWVALEAEGLGANLQHYNPLIDAKVAAEWNIPADWELNAQLVFDTSINKIQVNTKIATRIITSDFGLN
ncbi:hypothetical protein EYC84_002044 [Monilinia fructicola]|uniref:Nitroreductase domain-containing protein n=1 Tax=Monilinia fructicola TaxID=38448 RepID=A0A5M9JRJ7_MONFR|nr:hypothetical protein EYC84_002044 [Monilinia fructicola]